MKTARMTKAAAVEAMAAILAQFPESALDKMADDAVEAASLVRATRVHAREWPKFNAELAEDEDLRETTGGRTSLTWEEYIDWSREHGEWRSDWPTPAQPK